MGVQKLYTCTASVRDPRRMRPEGGAVAEKTFVNPASVYAPTWQFNQAVKTRGGELLFVSGIVGYEPDGSIARGDLVRQAEVAFENLRTVVEEAGGTMRDVVKVTVFLGESFELHKDRLRPIRERYFTEDFPASTLVQVAGFANPDYLFEIEAFAVIG